MPEKDPPADAVSVAPWYVYIVHCSDLTYYTGITTNLARRLAEHNSAHKGAKYTKPRRPVNLVYSEPALSRASAAKREYQIKHMTVADKKKLITTITTCVSSTPLRTLQIPPTFEDS